jgi:hypothetical protein
VGLSDEKYLFLPNLLEEYSKVLGYELDNTLMYNYET